MCDTILAPPSATAGQVMLLGKNSDRQRNEAQTVELFPSADHAPGSTLPCTYITIPQAPRTYAVVLCRPFWIWGAEMGANEHGVVIGNEGLHARGAAPEQRALIGMDLLRLALERAVTAAEAVNVITRLLERYGQGGNCGHLTPSYYNNGFLIADSADAFVLETIGREWLVERVGDVRALSNRYSIGREIERKSERLSDVVRELGSRSDEPVDYAEILADPLKQHIGDAIGRRERATSRLRFDAGKLRATNIMAILRDHGVAGDTDVQWNPRTAPTRTLCMHAGSWDRPGQTTGAMVSEVGRKHAVHWVTGSAAPCISIFKPVLLDASLPAHGPSPTDRFDPRTLWWRHERLHRAVLRNDFARFLADIREERDALEADFQNRVQAAMNGASGAERASIVAECWNRATELEDRWLARIGTPACAEDTSYHAAWSDMDRIAQMQNHN